MKRNFLVTLLLFFAFLNCGKDNVIGPHIPTIALEALRVEAIEVALEVILTDTLLPRTFELRRDGMMIFVGQMSGTQTTVVDTTVLPARSYLYRAVRTINGEAVDSSDVLTVTTLDTTSHNYTWEIQTIGVFQSSLSDVWGSSSTDVYAVGRIARTDSVDYNAIHFDGQTWTPFYILFASNPSAIGPPQLFGIYGFSKDDIWAVGVGGIVAHWDGIKWTTICLGVGDNCSGLLPKGEQLNAIWGTSSQDLFAVGVGGVIVHYDGQRWTKIASATDINLWDVWGFSSTDVYCAGADFFGGQGIVLHYDGTQWQPIAVDPNRSFRHFSVWGTEQNHVMTTGDFTYRFDGVKWRKQVVPDLVITKFRVRGASLTNFFIVGSFGLTLHWNGSTWRRYDEVSFEGNLFGIWATDNEAFLVGRTNALGVIIHGKSF